MATSNGTRPCLRCKQKLPADQFASTTSPFFPGHRSIICTNCLEQMVDATSLEAVNRLCQWLDIPFNPDIWIQLQAKYNSHTLTAYLSRVAALPYQQQTWHDEDARWRAIRERNAANAEIQAFAEAHLDDLHARWSPEYCKEDLVWLDEFYKNIIATQNVSTPILEMLATDLCETELQIKKGLRAGEDVKKWMDVRDNIIRTGNFNASNSKTASSLESVGELMLYCGKKGFHPTYHTEPKDSTDFLMKNIQDYNQRLIMNEGNIAELVEEKRDAYNLSATLEDETNVAANGITDAIEYEGEDEFAEEVSEFEGNS